MSIFSRITRKRRWLHGFAVLPVLALVAVLVPGMSSAIVSGSPSNFEASDGNMTVEPPPLGQTTSLDWNCFANGAVSGFASNVDTGTGTCPTLTAGQKASTVVLHPGTTEAKSGVETTWKSGQKLDVNCPVVSNSSVPNKDDFTDIAQYFEVDSSLNPYLYGAEIRATANGNSSGNIEMNQLNAAEQPSLSCTWWRSAGDRLLAFDFLSGGTTLNFHALTWITAANPTAGNNSGSCFISHDSLPCWGAQVISGTNQGGDVTVGGCNSNGTEVEGCSNGSAIGTDAAGKSFNGISGTNLVANQFAEFGVNLFQALGIHGCSNFAQEVWESRSSGSSFTSNPEDIETLTSQLSNCGSITVTKTTTPSGANHSFSYTTTSTVSNTSVPGSFNLNAGCPSGTANCTNTQTFSGLPPGTYTVTEGSAPGWGLGSLTCTDNGSSTVTHSTITLASSEVSIGLQPNDNVSCVYNNVENLGAIQITKVSSKTAAPTLAGAGFEVCTNQGPYSAAAPCLAPTGVTNTGTTDANGVLCIDGLPWSSPLTDYYVQETSPPSGYALNATNFDVAVSANATCPSGTNTGTGVPATQTVQDTPLTDLSVTAQSEAVGGTKSTVNCTDSSSNSVGSSTSYPTSVDPASTTITGLQPGTYTCTVVIDP